MICGWKVDKRNKGYLDLWNLYVSIENLFLRISLDIF